MKETSRIILVTPMTAQLWGLPWKIVSLAVGTTPVIMNPSQPFTYAGWVYVTDKTAQQGFIGASSASSRAYTGLRSGNYWIGLGGSQKYSVAANLITNNTWFHFALVCTGTLGTLYINGVSVDSLAYSSGTTSHPVYLGAVNDNSSAIELITGKEDEISIYTVALPQSDIKRLMLNLHPLTK